MACDVLGRQQHLPLWRLQTTHAVLSTTSTGILARVDPLGPAAASAGTSPGGPCRLGLGQLQLVQSDEPLCLLRQPVCASPAQQPHHVQQLLELSCRCQHLSTGLCLCSL
jgi:hypothetical protein